MGVRVRARLREREVEEMSRLKGKKKRFNLTN